VEYKACASKEWVSFVSPLEPVLGQENANIRGSSKINSEVEFVNSLEGILVIREPSAVQEGRLNWPQEQL
jgi:hypothetical protein